MAPPTTLAPPKPSASVPPRRPKNKPPTFARFIIDELRGEAGYVSEDIWRDVFGFKRRERSQEELMEDIDMNGEFSEANVYRGVGLRGGGRADRQGPTAAVTTL